MFTSRHLVEWLEEHTTSRAQVYNDRIPPTGRIIYVRMSSGPGLDLEGVQDNITFTIECRGSDRNYDDAELIAWDVDRAILQYGRQPHEFGDGSYMYFVGRAGGPPSQLIVADTAGRYAFTCNYYVTVATDI
jgi:hypothetical protein